MTRIGLIGCGFVGSAVLNAIKSGEIYICDEDAGYESGTTFFAREYDVVFVCVPTNSKPDGSVNDAIVRSVVGQITGNPLIIVKSTITPDHLIDLSRGRRLVYNPEFLTQRNAKADFLEPHALIFGGKEADCAEALSFYRNHTAVHECPVFITDVATAALVKYATNSFLAVKVAFMNEMHALHLLCTTSSWEDFTRIFGSEPRIGKSHLQVPGPDGRKGFGGACLPKDTAALIHYAEGLEADLAMIRQARAWVQHG